jgi:HEAT repeat protein
MAKTGTRNRVGLFWPLGVLLMAAVGGCANKKEAVVSLPGVVSPAERITALRKQADNAGKSEAQPAEQVAQQLTAEIQREEDPLLRAEIVRTLSFYPCDGSDRVLRVALNDPDADVRMAACAGWGKRGNAEAARLLAGVLSGDINHDVRFAAARALAHAHDPAAVTALAAALEDGDPAMQYRAVESLREVTGQDLGNNVDRWREYARNGSLKPADQSSFASRIRHMF